MKLVKITALLFAALATSACVAPDIASRNSLSFASAAQDLPGGARAFDLSPDAAPVVSVVGVDVRMPGDLDGLSGGALSFGGDFIWTGETGPRSRAEIAEVIRAATRVAQPALNGAHETILQVQLERFHATSGLARLAQRGKDVAFTWVLTDASSGELLTQPKQVEANLGGRLGADEIAARLGDVLLAEIMADTGWKSAQN